MATGKALNGKPYAGNPHVRFDEGEVASAATPRRGSLLYNTTSQSPFTDLTSAAHPYLPVKIDLGDTPPASAFRVVLCSVTPAAANYLRGHIDVLTSVKGFTCSIVEDDVTYKNTALKRFTAVFCLKGMSILFR